MIEIDGSFGEGGGQILRTALSLSCLFRKSFRIFNIRKSRRKPGLMPQHLTAVRAAQLIANAAVEGDTTGSTELTFVPKEIRGGELFFDIGTAGSTSLVLQTLIPALICLGEKTTVTLKGGTHVPFSPSYHYLKDIFTHFLREIGIHIDLTIESHGFYPKGGGKVRAEIFPAREIRPLRITDRGALLRLGGYSCVGNLPLSIAERQRNSLVEKIHSQKIPSFIKEGKMVFEKYPVDIELLHIPTPGQGTFVFLKSEFENSVAGFTSLGQRGRLAEAVGEDAALEFLHYYATGSALDPHMADQIILYLVLCGGESALTTSCITQHLITNLRVIGMFHDYRYSVDGEPGSPGTVTINPDYS
jgi:RNA 3'-terminal phosphate cyclase (ATP)